MRGMAHRVDVPGGASGPVAEPAAAEKPHQFGLPAAMALIVGSIIGVGIFNLPTSLAAYGPITLISMALTTVGALALALLFAALSRRLPADGGSYAYARVAFGNRLGFANAWSYWITARAGNAAIAPGKPAPADELAWHVLAVERVLEQEEVDVIAGLGVALDFRWKHRASSRASTRGTEV